MTTTYVKHPVTGGAAEVARLVLTDKNGTPKEVSALWKDGVCLFAKKGALVKNGNEMEDIDGNDVMAWSLPSDTPVPRHTYPWESEIIPLHDEDRWYVIVPNSVVVTMGGVDITDTCYDAETHKISIPMVKGDISVEAEATEVIQFETEMQTLPSVTFLGQREETADEDFVDDGLAHIVQIEGNTFVWNQLLEHTGSQVETISTAVYYKRINGVESVFTSEGETITAETDTDMLINLTHLYGANARDFPLDPTNENTLAQFKTFFPLDYYPYSAPRLMNLAITSITASSNGLSKVLDLDVKNITGKLNGSGNSVKVFPYGMAGSAIFDTIVKEDGVWKAIVKVREVYDFDMKSVTWTLSNNHYRYQWSSAEDCAMTTSTAETAPANVVCDKLMSVSYGSLIIGTNGKTGFCCIQRTSSSANRYFFGFSKQDYETYQQNDGLPTISFLYSLANVKTYVLDDAWQTILDQTFHYTKSGILTTETNTAEPTTAPLTIAVASNIRGWKVKPICVANWGGGIIDGEFTAKEAAAVISLNDVFYENYDIRKFNEFKYFLGITSLWSKTVSSYPNGQFYYCRKLESITIPKSITSFAGAFKNCVSLKEIDFSPITAQEDVAFGDALRCTSAASSLKKITFGNVKISSFYNFANRRTGLEEIEIKGTLTFSENSLFSSCFYQCNRLTTITGRIENIVNNISFSYSPLSVESALVVLNGLANNNSGETRTVTFSESTRRLLTPEDDAIATNKNWNIAPTKYQVNLSLVGCEVVENVPYALDGSAWEVTINKPWEQTAYIGMTVTMGGTDITETAWDESTRKISISSVSGDIAISVEATEIIQFEDNAVKAICVSNWGGNYVQDEITAKEAAAVTSLNSAFKENTTIVSFNELRYFIGLNTLYVSGSSTSSQGEFYKCTALTEIILPKNITNLSGAFRGCDSLLSIDLSVLDDNNHSSILMNCAFYSCSNLTSITLPLKIRGMIYALRACSKLNTILGNTTFDYSQWVAGVFFNTTFGGCSRLQNIIGTWNNIGSDILLSSCQNLTRASALVIINGLDLTVDSAKTVTFHASTYALLTEDDLSIVEGTNWSIASA